MPFAHVAEHPLLGQIYDIIEHRHFQRATLIMVLLNCVLLMLPVSIIGIHFSTLHNRNICETISGSGI